jgi:hypothetical protein
VAVRREAEKVAAAELRQREEREAARPASALKPFSVAAVARFDRY